MVTEQPDSPPFS